MISVLCHFILYYTFQARRMAELQFSSTLGDGPSADQAFLQRPLSLVRNIFQSGYSQIQSNQRRPTKDLQKGTNDTASHYITPTLYYCQYHRSIFQHSSSLERDGNMFVFSLFAPHKNVLIFYRQ